MRQIVEVNGKKIGDGETVTLDHSVQTFIVKVRSLGHVSPNTIKDLIEKRHEVVSIEQTDELTVVRGSSVRDF